MCENVSERVSIVHIPCRICVVDDCDIRKNNVAGCVWGKPSNELTVWAFEYTNHLRSIGVKAK